MPSNSPAPPPPDGAILVKFAGDAWIMPLTWWQSPPVSLDGVNVTTPGVPVDMTGLTPSAEFLGVGQTSGTPLMITNFVPLAGSFVVTVPGKGQAGDLTSELVPGPALAAGPRVRVHYRDSLGNPQTFGTFYVTVR